MSLSSSATPLLETESSLKTGLQSVLRSLDVGLEDELARYRRKKRLQQTQSPKVARSASRLAEPRGVAKSPVEEARAALGQLTQSPGLGDKLFPKSVSKTETVPEAVSAVEVGPTVEPDLTGAVPLESSLVSLPQLDSASTQSETATDSADAGATAGLAQTSNSDDYFASSAALLESLAQPEEEEPLAQSDSRNAIAEKLLSPAGVGSSMLLLLGSATAGYLLLHPESLSHLQVSNLTAKPTTTTATASASSVDPELPPGAPDLSQKEFVDLTLSNLGRLNLRPGSTAPVANLPTVPSPILPGSASANAAVNSTPANMPVVTVTPQKPQRGLLSNLANAVAGSSSKPSPVIQAPPAPATLRMSPETPLPTVLPAPPVLPPAPIAAAAPVVSEESWESENTVVSEESTSEFAVLGPTPEIFLDPAFDEASEPISSDSGASETGVGNAVEFSDSAEWVEPAPEVNYSQSSSAEVGTFVVVVPYKSDLALSQAQQFAPDAYVRNTEAGALIQIGIHDSAETANSVVEQLQREGLNAYVE